MVKVDYTITVPTGLDKIPAPTPQVVAYREEIMTWSMANGLVDNGMTETATVRELFYTWIDQDALDAFVAHFGQGYVDYYDDMVAEIEAIPGTIVRNIEMI